MIGDWSLILHRKYKEKEQRGRFGEIDEKISREEYTLDWSQSKVFLVNFKFHFTAFQARICEIGEPGFQLITLTNVFCLSSQSASLSAVTHSPGLVCFFQAVFRSHNVNVFFSYSITVQ